MAHEPELPTPRTRSRRRRPASKLPLGWLLLFWGLIVWGVCYLWTYSPGARRLVAGAGPRGRAARTRGANIFATVVFTALPTAAAHRAIALAQRRQEEGP